MASSANRIRPSLHSLLSVRPSLSSSRLPSATRRRLSTVAVLNPDAELPSSFPSSAEEEEKKKDDTIYLKKSSSVAATRDAASVMMPMLSMRSIVGKRFYKEVTTRLADDANRICTSLHSLLSVRPFLSSFRLLSATRHRLSTVTAPNSDVEPSSFFPLSAKEKKKKDDTIYLKKSRLAAATRDAASVMMPMSSMTGSIIGKHFYKEVTTWLADDGNGCMVMLGYRTLQSQDPFQEAPQAPEPRPCQGHRRVGAPCVHLFYSFVLLSCFAFLNSTFPYFLSISVISLFIYT